MYSHKLLSYVLRGRVSASAVRHSLHRLMNVWREVKSTRRWNVSHKKHKWGLTFSHCAARSLKSEANRPLKVNIALTSSRQSSFTSEKCVWRVSPVCVPGVCPVCALRTGGQQRGLASYLSQKVNHHHRRRCSSFTIPIVQQSKIHIFFFFLKNRP